MMQIAMTATVPIKDEFTLTEITDAVKATGAPAKGPHKLRLATVGNAMDPSSANDEQVLVVEWVKEA